MSRVDNIWGFPGYALERAITDRSLSPLWKILTEPILAEFYNPTPNQIYRGIDREADRIGWQTMLVPGRAELVRWRRGGGYFSLVHPSDGASPFALRATHVHLGLGYPTLRYSEIFTEYRLRHGDFHHVVSAYEPHEHVYEVLKRRPGTVVVRGAGIVASRVLQRLLDDRVRSGHSVQIVHCFRKYADDPETGWPARRVGDGWRYQAFNFPKAAFAGQLHQRLLTLDPLERAALIRLMGQPTTARRRIWQRQLRHARRTGYYRRIQAQVLDMAPRAGKVLLTLAPKGSHDHESLEADYVIDCMGLEPDIRRNPVLADLLAYGGAATNPLCGLDVHPSFEVCGTRSEPGRIYASGVIARGGHLAPVDSFFGSAYAALRICDDLADLSFSPRLHIGRSVLAWLNWLTNRSP
jgi:hypothetical protein